MYCLLMCVAVRCKTERWESMNLEMSRYEIHIPVENKRNRTNLDIIQVIFDSNAPFPRYIDAISKLQQRACWERATFLYNNHCFRKISHRTKLTLVKNINFHTLPEL